MRDGRFTGEATPPKGSRGLGHINIHCPLCHNTTVVCTPYHLLSCPNGLHLRDVAMQRLKSVFNNNKHLLQTQWAAQENRFATNAMEEIKQTPQLPQEIQDFLADNTPQQMKTLLYQHCGGLSTAAYNRCEKTQGYDAADDLLKLHKSRANQQYATITTHLVMKFLSLADLQAQTATLKSNNMCDMGIELWLQNNNPLHLVAPPPEWEHGLATMCMLYAALYLNLVLLVAPKL